jgi:hypothetical protein
MLFTKAGGVLAAALVVILGFIGWHFEYGTERTVTFKVTGLDDQGNYKGHKYLVTATLIGGDSPGKIEVFQDTDAYLHGKMDSSDVWARFVNAGAGAVWRCPVYGYRLFISSSYRNILDGCELISKGNPAALPNL